MGREILSYFKEEVFSIKRQMSALSNDVFIVETKKGKFVFKECRSDLDSRISELLGTPKILLKHGSVLIEEYIEHRVVDFDRDWKEIARALRSFHGTAVPAGMGDHGTMIDLFMSYELNTHGNDVVRALKKVRKKVIEILGKSAEIPGVPVRFGLCHNDLQPGNILMAKERATFIDFEYSSVGEQLVDIANLFCEVMCDYDRSKIDIGRAWPDSRKIEFLREYFDHDEEIDYGVVLSRINDLELFSHFLWYLWGRNSLTKGRKNWGRFSYHRYIESRMQCLKRIIDDASFSALKEDLITLGTLEGIL